ncbi:MAG TPA: M28 family peptidase [Thermomicrobiales bacterium]|jgi:Iap family predicted aminopeptidase|nr:M28 family peptidase [Thermomicrobiales bacterium]
MTHQTTAATGRMLEIVAEATADNLLTYTRDVSQWVRMSGSDDERKAFAVIEELVRGWGLDVQRAEPVCLTSWPVAASITLPGGETVTCITHSFSGSTPGVTGELIDAGDGSPEAYTGLDLAGKIALVTDPASPGKAVAAEPTGALAVIHVNPGETIKEMIVSPVWGSPTPETIDLLPTLPHVSVNRASGDRLREAMAAGAGEVTVTTEVDTRWRPLPLLVATIPAGDPDGSGDFVLLSGHVDSWHYGAIDNGTADACALETARVLAAHRDELRRDVRVAFWSGHSHARYGTSAWYADEHWLELYEHCVAHVNIDMPGYKGATDLTQAPLTAEAFGMAGEVIAAIGEQELAYHRMQRMGDQSFWGAGVPSVFMNISAAGPGVTMEWYHTPLDTMDYIDPALLERDGRILLGATWRLASDEILPLDQLAPAEEILAELRALDAVAGGAFNMLGLLADAEGLVEAAGRLRDARSTANADAASLNDATKAASRALMPVNYTSRGPFEQDLALPIPTLPGLQAVRELVALPEGSPERLTLETRLRRERNRLAHALREARFAIEAALF